MSETEATNALAIFEGDLAKAAELAQKDEREEEEEEVEAPVPARRGRKAVSILQFIIFIFYYLFICYYFFDYFYFVVVEETHIITIVDQNPKYKH